MNGICMICQLTIKVVFLITHSTFKAFLDVMLISHVTFECFLSLRQFEAYIAIFAHENFNLFLHFVVNKVLPAKCNT